MSWSRDASGKPTARRTQRSQPGAHPLELDARGYQWRGEDQIAAIVDAAQGPRWFDHDGRGRLIRERLPGDSPIHGDRVLHRAMDAVGNIFRSPDLSDRRYGPGGRIEEADGTRYEHDALGNLIRKTEPDGSEWRYLWNGAGMLKEVVRPDGKHVGFEYDVFARRTRKILFTEDDSDLVGPRDPRARRMQDFPPWEPKKIIECETLFVWDGHTVLHELSSNEGLTTWYWEPGTFTPIAKERGKHFWSLAHDHLGTPTEMYDEQGKLVWQMELDTFGEPTFGVGKATDCPWRWPGQYEDSDTGLYCNRFRFFDPKTSRYVSIDPIGIFGGTDLLGYVTDPLLWIDPLGLAKKCGGGGTTVYRQLSADDVANLDAGRGLIPRGSDGSIANHIQGQPTEHISASLTREATERFSSGNGLARIDVEEAIEGGSRYIDHNNVMQAARRSGDSRIVRDARRAEEVMFRGPIPQSAVRRGSS